MVGKEDRGVAKERVDDGRTDGSIARAGSRVYGGTVGEGSRVQCVRIMLSLLSGGV